jgi:carboxyl-terminal processing protease
MEFTITRDEIPIYSIDASYMVDNEIGYIKLTRFAATTMDEFYKALDKLEKQGMKGLILDLRGNGGGYLNVAVDLVDEFLPDDKMILYTEGNNSPKKVYNTRNKGRFEQGHLAVLLNEGSASASENFAGAIQDWDRGILIGRRTFGKGLVQRPFNLKDGSMIRLTIARYYTPTGRLIQKPYDKGLTEYKQDINNRYTHGELSNIDSIRFPDSLKFFTLTKKRTVYGGGGIMPDIFTPIDTTGYSDYYKNIIGKGIMNNFIINYIDSNREKLYKKYPDFKLYKNNFLADDEILKELVEFAKKENLEYKDKEFQTSKSDLRMQLKALIARDLWSTSEYYEIMNSINASFSKAVEVLKKNDIFATLLEKK